MEFPECSPDPEGGGTANTRPGARCSKLVVEHVAHVVFEPLAKRARKTEEQQREQPLSDCLPSGRAHVAHSRTTARTAADRISDCRRRTSSPSTRSPRPVRR